MLKTLMATLAASLFVLSSPSHADEIARMAASSTAVRAEAEHTPVSVPVALPFSVNMFGYSFEQKQGASLALRGLTIGQNVGTFAPDCKTTKTADTPCSTSLSAVPTFRLVERLSSLNNGGRFNASAIVRTDAGGKISVIVAPMVFSDANVQNAVGTLVARYGTPTMVAPDELDWDFIEGDVALIADGIHGLVAVARVRGVTADEVNEILGLMTRQYPLQGL